MRIDIWSDIACPWCFIGLTRFRLALDGFEHADAVDVRVRSFQLDPGLPQAYQGSEADYLAATKGLSPAAAHRMTSQVAQVAAADGLSLDFGSLVVANSRRAHRLLHAAARVSPQAAVDLELALFRAHFSEGESIWDADVLTTAAAVAGMDPETATAALDDADLDAEVAADITTAAGLGITGVPFFVLDDRYGISGAQQVETFAAALATVWDELHPAPATLVSVAGSPGPACGPDGC